MRDQIVGVRRIEEALQRQVIHGGDLETNLLEAGGTSEDVLAQYRAQVEGLVPVSAWEVMHPDEAACRLLTPELAAKHRMLPLRIEGTTLIVAVADSPPTEALDELSFLLSIDVVPRLTTEMRLAVGLGEAYGLDVTPRLRRLADKLPPVAPLAAQESATARSEVARRSALPPIPAVPVAAGTPRPTRRSAPPPAPEPVAAAAASEAPSGSRTAESPRPWPQLTMAATLASLDGADLDDDETTLVPESTLLAAKLASARPSTRATAPADESLAERVMALVAEKPVEPERAVAVAVVEPSTPSRAGDTERVATEPRVAPMRKRPVLTPGVAAELLAAATNRDEILELFLQVAAQFFEYVAIFVVQDEVADGRLAHGPGTSTQAIRQVSVPLDGGGLLASARSSGVHYLGPLPDEPRNRELLRGLGRESPVTALVVPVQVRSRIVLLLWADDGGRPIAPEQIGIVLATAPRAGAALEHLIVARKFAGYSGGGDRGHRTAIGAPTKELAAKTRPSTPVPTELIAVPPPPGTEAAPESAGDTKGEPTEPWYAIKTPTNLVRPAPAPVPESSRQPTQKLGGLTALAPPITATAEEPSGTVQIAAPPPVADPVPAPADSEPTPKIPVPVQPAPAPPDDSEDEEEEEEQEEDEEEDEEVSIGAADDHEDREPMVDVGQVSDDEVPTGVGAPALRDTEPAPAPQPVQPPELGPVSGSTTGKKRSYPEAFRVDVVSLPAAGTGTVPSIIVDMGSNIEALVESLMRSGEEGDLAAAALQKIGEVALPALIQRFPGPLLFDRHAAHTRLPRVGDCGPLLRVLPTFRRIVVPYLLPLLASRDEETRFYATFLFSEIQYPEAIPKLAPLLFDPDYQTRILAIDVLKGFRRFEEFDAITKELRETAWIATNPMSRRRIAVEAIGELRDAGAVAMLIELVDVEDQELSDLAWKALVLITRQDFGKVKKRWKMWLQKEGARHHIEWLIDALVHPSPELRLGASEELKRITREYFGYYYNLPKRDREKARKRYLEWWERIGRARFTSHS